MNTLNKIKFNKNLALNIGAIAATGYAVKKSVYTIETGNVGLEEVFGVLRYGNIKPGLHVKYPLTTTIHKYSIKTHIDDVDCNVNSAEGLNITVKLSIQFRLDPNNIYDIHSKLGYRFDEVIIKPAINSALRNITAAFEAKDLYTSKSRAEMLKQLNEKVKSETARHGIIVEDIKFKDIILPLNLILAIENKLKAEQESQRMEFTLHKEKMEAKRKVIEARGIADFQQIVTQGISPRLLQWKAIETTLKLAESNNSKVILIGNSDGLPVMLDTK